MNIRVLVTVCLSVAFVVLLTSGILLFSTKYNYLVASLHVWASILVLISFIWHLKNNWNAYKNHIRLRQGRWVFFATLIGVIPVTVGIVAELPPFASVLQFGEKLRSSGSVKEGEFTVIDLNNGSSERQVEVFIKAGESYESAPQPLFLGLTYTTTPQIVIWQESMQGEYLRTLYLTGKSSNSSFQAKPGESKIIRRPEALPYWGHKRGVKAEDGLFLPDLDSSEFDGVSSATPKSDHLLVIPNQDSGRYRIMMEVNRSYDFNDYYSADRFPDDDIYSGSGSSGQPSLVYQAVVDSNSTTQTLFELIGHGHHSGKNGKLFKDLSKVTSAKQLISFGVVQIRELLSD
jgi:hypothetical protein